MCLNQLNNKKREKEKRQVLSVLHQPSFCSGRGALDPPRTQEPAAFPTLNKSSSVPEQGSVNSS